MLRLQAQAIREKGLCRSVSEVIRRAIDEYLERHAEEREQVLKEKREKLGKEEFAHWKRQAQQGLLGYDRPRSPYKWVVARRRRGV